MPALKTAIVWFRRDLRLADNPALRAAAAACERLVPVYIHSLGEAGDWRPGGASRWWLHESLAALDASLRARGSRLFLRRGPLLAHLQTLVERTGAEAIYWNRRYDPALATRDRAVEAALLARGLAVHTFNAGLLHEPWELTRRSQAPYRVFSAFARAAAGRAPAPPLPAPRRLPPPPARPTAGTLADLRIRPRIPWYTGLAGHWTPGETGARQRLSRFLRHGLADYAEGRDRPDRALTSTLSPHLHFGEIGPRQVADAVRRARDRAAALHGGAQAFLRQLLWREFAHHLLHHFPGSAEQALNPRFAALPWAQDYGEALQRWQRGETGIPLVDAGMRQLWQTGWMHNRVRMVAASFLTKNLLIPWQEGARWFWDTLVDADLANNTLGWQWVAGTGADAAPFFRVFNPVLQGQRFDPQGGYVRRWLPELAALPDRWVHQPWRAPDRVLAQAGVRLGVDYPEPMVNLEASRARALAAFATMKTRAPRAGTRRKAG